jgi:hypothetical protein
MSRLSRGARRPLGPLKFSTVVVLLSPSGSRSRHWLLPPHRCLGDEDFLRNFGEPLKAKFAERAFHEVA